MRTPLLLLAGLLGWRLLAEFGVWTPQLGVAGDNTNVFADEEDDTFEDDGLDASASNEHEYPDDSESAEDQYDDPDGEFAAAMRAYD